MGKILYPASLESSFPPIVPIALTESLQLVHNFGTAEVLAHRIPLIFDGPAHFLILIESNVAERRNWRWGGYLAQCLYDLPGDPKKAVERLYIDEKFIKLDGAGYPYYLEFWPVRWLSDYYLEIWAQEA